MAKEAVECNSNTTLVKVKLVALSVQLAEKKIQIQHLLKLNFTFFLERYSKGRDSNTTLVKVK